MTESPRKYGEHFIMLGFIRHMNAGKEVPYCIFCKKCYANSAMKYNILKNHFNNLHYFYRHKSIEFFENEERKAREDDPTFKTISISDSLKFKRISFEIAYMIAKQKTPHTIAESLIKPCIIKVCEILFGDKDVSKIECIPLSNSTISRRISDISDHLLAKTIFEIKSSQDKLFSIQLDETTDVSSCAQLMVYVRYIYDNKLKEEFLFCSPLQTTTKSKDILELVTIFFEGVGLLWENVCGCCTDGAPAMLGSKSGFQTLVKKLSPQIKGIHCMIHRYALVCKTIPSELNYILRSIIKMVNYIKGSALNSRVFKKLCADLDSEQEVLLYHTEVRWLSKGNMLKRAFDLKKELLAYFETLDDSIHLTNLRDELWILRFAYLTDIFELLNGLNRKMQGKKSNIVNYSDSLNCFIEKITNWSRKLDNNDYEMFINVNVYLKNVHINEESIILFKNEVKIHLSSLQSEFSRYFPDIKIDEFDLLRSPFTFEVDKLPSNIQDEFIELRNDSFSRDLFKNVPFDEFWPQMFTKYPNLAHLAARILVPFASTYLCESGFSTLLQIKSKTRNKLMSDNDIRCALSSINADIEEICNKI